MDSANIVSFVALGVSIGALTLTFLRWDLAARGRSGFVARGGGPVRCVVLQGTSRGGSCWIASGSGLRAGS